jgi:hypothetical protein
MGLKEEFTLELRGTIEAARNRNYIPTYFIRMLDQYDGVETAKRLLATSEFQSGLIKLYELELLEDSMERVVIKPKYSPLFDEDEIEEARRRLRALGFKEE